MLFRFLFTALLLCIVQGVQAKDKGLKKESQNMSAVPATSSLLDLKVEKYQLENGMSVLLHQDKRTPQVFHQLLVKVGSRDEIEGKTGLAHLFEHMMFRGTAKYTGEEYEQRLESIGARNNAFTSRDYTAYHTTLPKHKLEMILEMEAERLNTLQLTAGNLEKEVEVVKEERRQRTDNNPGEIFEPMLQLIFKSHPYGRPILGSMEDLKKMSVEDCKEFYQSYYSPNNSILVLAGDFEIDQAKKWIQKYYGALEAYKTKYRENPKEPKQVKQRVSQIKRAIQSPMLAFAYRGPKVGEDGTYSLEVLNRILADGESSRLHQELVYKNKLALSVGGFYYGLKEDGIFLIFVKMAPGGDLEKVKEIFLSEMDKAKSSEVSKNELLKSTRSIMNEYVSTVKSLDGKSNALSSNEAYFNDYRELFKDLSRYEKVTAKTIKEEAGLYIAPEKLSMVELLPLKKSEEQIL